MKVRLMALAVLSVVAMAACAPRWPAGSGLTATDDGAYVVVGWSPANPYVAEDPVTAYGIEVNGVEVSRVEPWATSCVLKGLANSTTYTISVTAYDSAGRFSGNLANNGRLSVSHTTAATGNSGPTLFCDTAPPPPID